MIRSCLVADRAGDLDAAGAEDPGATPQARAIWDDVDGDVRAWIACYRTELTDTITAELTTAGTEAATHENEAFMRRINEVTALQRDQSIDKLKREIEAPLALPDL